MSLAAPAQPKAPRPAPAKVPNFLRAERALLERFMPGLAENAMYVASGFAEGRSGATPLDMTMRARPAPGGGWLITGRKKPCSLSHSMDFLSCGLVTDTGDGVRRRGVGMVPADAPGI